MLQLLTSKIHKWSSRFIRIASSKYFMKQNQSTVKIVPGAKPELKRHDFLTHKAPCTCSQCDTITQPINPEIVIDQELNRLRSNANHNKECDFIFFLNHLRKSQKHLPKFRFLDTVVMRGGEAAYALHFEGGKMKISEQVNPKAWVLGRKEMRDLKYQIERHEIENNFNFTAFEHKCQKKIKQFQNNIKYKIPAVLNRVAIIKLFNREEEAVLSKHQFQNLFDANKSKTYQLENIEYIQVFPVMHGEEERSYVKTIKYFRVKECKKKSFKLAESYVSTWREKNDSLEKLQENVYDEIRKSQGLQELDEDSKLYYQTYKLCIYFQEVSNIRIQQAVLHFITNNRGKSFFFKDLECLKTETRASVEDKTVDLPVKKEISPQQYIDLPQEMRKLFDGFQSQFQRLNKQREEMEKNLKKDKEYSNYVFNTICSQRKESLHSVLGSRNMKFKKAQLNL